MPLLLQTLHAFQCDDWVCSSIQIKQRFVLPFAFLSSTRHVEVHGALGLSPDMPCMAQVKESLIPTPGYQLQLPVQRATHGRSKPADLFLACMLLLQEKDTGCPNGNTHA